MKSHKYVIAGLFLGALMVGLQVEAASKPLELWRKFRRGVVSFGRKLSDIFNSLSDDQKQFLTVSALNKVGSSADPDMVVTYANSIASGKPEDVVGVYLGTLSRPEQEKALGDAGVAKDKASELIAAVEEAK